MTELSIYPSGFVGKLQEPVIVRPTRASDRYNLDYDSSIFDPKQECAIIANLEVDKLYSALMRGDAKPNNFEFREKALHVILKSFGTDSYNLWYLKQFSSPEFSETHVNFIEDCMEFINTGHRSITLNTWMVLINSPDNIKCELAGKKALNFAGIYSMSDIEQPKYTKSIIDLVSEWLSKPKGFEDLLVSCHIMYGIRDI